MPKAPESAAPSPAATLKSRFEALHAYPTFDELCAYNPRTTAASLGLGGQLIGGYIAMVISLFLVVVCAFVGGPFALAPLVILGFATTNTLNAHRKAARFDLCPITFLPSAVLGERVKVSGGGRDSSATTMYYATLADSEGDRKEYRALETVASKLIVGDMGIAFIKDKYLVEFLPVPV